MSFSTPDFDEQIQVYQSENQILLDWFQDNCMQANPDKFQAIAVGKRTLGENLVWKISWFWNKMWRRGETLWVDIDYQLNFDQHVSSLYRKAGQELNVLKRLSPFFYLS